MEKLDTLTVDYLGLCAVNASLRRRKDTTSEDQVNRRIANVEAQLRNPALGGEEARQLRATLAEYTEVLNRSRRLAVRRSSLEATLVSMPDKMEEVYQLVITSPYATDMGSKLEDSLSRLRIAEEVAAEFDDADLATFGNPPSRASAARNAPTTAARQARAASENLSPTPPLSTRSFPWPTTQSSPASPTSGPASSPFGFRISRKNTLRSPTKTRSPR